MSEERVQRRLAAILAADVVGYSKMMGRDEAGTLAQLKSLRSEFLHPKVAEYGGRIVKTTGDGTLIEFGSAVDAVSHAVDVQRGMAERNAGLPKERQLRLRLGINVGDIIIDGDDIFGDGVNIAARLEALAEPGGICISARVRDYIGDRLDISVEDLGAQSMKNIAEPVHAYRIRIDSDARLEGVEPQGSPSPPDKPSIAVLPFDNMSGDPEQEYFADGMVEEIITGLSRVRSLTVIARNSSFAFKGLSTDVREIAGKLGVRYVLEGSVRKAGERVRITAQLIEAESGGHLWADRFDGTLADVFDLQDEITAGVVAAIEPNVRRAEIERAKRKRPGNLDAYDLYLRALEQACKFTPAGRDAALSLLDEALVLDPDYVQAHGVAAFCHQQRFLWGGQAPEDREAGLKHAGAVAAAQTDDATALAFAALAMSLLAESHTAALAIIKRALAQTPSSAWAHSVGAGINTFRGEFDLCRSHAEQSLRLSPFDPQRHLPEVAIAVADRAIDRHEEALAGARRALESNPVFGPALLVEVLSLVRLGRLDEARAAARRLQDVAPDMRIGSLRRFAMTDALGGHDAIVAELRQAGLPE